MIGRSQWDSFIEYGIIFTEDSNNVFIGQDNPAGGDCFFYSILHYQHLCPTNITTVTDLRFAIWSFITDVDFNYSLCQDIHEAFHDSYDNDTFSEFVESIRTPHTWACSRTVLITSLFLHRDIIVVTNELNVVDGTTYCGPWKSGTSFKDRLGLEPEFSVSDEEKIYLYQHLHNKPLEPAPLIQLNHFCALQKRNRHNNDFIVPSITNNPINVYIVNNGVYQLQKTKSLTEKVKNNDKLLMNDESINQEFLKKEEKKKKVGSI